MNIYRVLRTLSAHGYGQIITVTSTIVIPSVAVTKWGTHEFGYWVSLSALAQFFLMADLGASTALTNQLCLKSARTAVDAWMLVRSVTRDFMKNGLIVTAGIIAISLLVGIYYVREHLTDQAAVLSVTFLALALSAALQPILGIYCAVWRFNGRNEVGIFISNTARLIELVAITASALMGGGVCIAATAALIAKIIVVAIIAYHMSRLVSNGRVTIPIEQGDQTIVELKSIKQAGHGFMLISLSQQLALHGPILLISAILGPVHAAIFAACRTLSRLPVQPLTILLASLNPELTDLIAKKQYKKMKLIVRRVAVPTIALSIIVGFSAVCYVDNIEKFWLAGKMHLDLKVLAPLCLAATLYLGGQVINQALTAANQTYDQSRQFMLVSTLMIVLMFLLLLFTGQAMWCAISVFFADALMIVLLIRRFTLFIAS